MGGMLVSTRRTLAAYKVFVALGAALTLAGCRGEEVTPGAIDRARGLWQKAGVRDYDLEWISTGPGRPHYQVGVRDGQVRTIGMIQPGGKVVPAKPAETRYYGVEGLFLIIRDDLEQRKKATPFGQPKGTRVVLRFTSDSKYGYPRSYRRDVLGSPLAIGFDVIRFVPDPPRIPSQTANE